MLNFLGFAYNFVCFIISYYTHHSYFMYTCLFMILVCITIIIKIPWFNIESRFKQMLNKFQLIINNIFLYELPSARIYNVIVRITLCISMLLAHLHSEFSDKY